MSQVTLNTTSSLTDVDSNMSLQFMYAKIQLMQSSISKTKCENLMKQLESSQEDQKKCAQMIETARNLQQQAKNGNTNTEMPADMVAYFKENGLSYDTDGNDNLHSKDQWEYNIKSLTNFQDTLGTDTQTKMVYLQQYMSEYNNYLSGASTQINNGSDTMKTILRNS